MPKKASRREQEALSNTIKKSLRAQGFRIRGDAIIPPKELDKDRVRAMHLPAVEHRRSRARDGLRTREGQLIKRFASGSEIAPALIRPRLVKVLPSSEDELLFRFASLQWSIPVSSGYGRRLRFLVIDEQNEKLIGLLGLGDPVFSLRPRDEWIGWDKETRKERLQNVMEAFVLGAVPPYSHLLAGKLVAMLVSSNEVRDAFRRKYSKAQSVINGRSLDGRLALVTTTSALGRSSIYRRVKYDERLLLHPLGYTRGSGEFHFSNGLYSAVSEYASTYCEPTAKQEAWGTGFRSRREVVRKTLGHLGLSTEWLYHGIKREVYAIPFAENTREFLRGAHSRLRWFGRSADDLFDFYRDRWLLPRAQRDPSYRYVNANSRRIWSQPDEQ
ncbi:MAG: Druantia anti-phage system protein DruA [Dehalococcoidia bacterium]